MDPERDRLKHLLIILLEALLQYSSFIALKPLEPSELESVLEQVLFRPGRPGMTGGASEGFENVH
jgi:hypothetical protein